MSNRVKRVVVVGADAPAWMAAAAIYASVGRTGVHVRVIELPTLLRPVDVYSALPALAGFHGRLGIPEDVLFKACKALPVAGHRLSNWSGAASAFMLGYDQLPGYGKSYAGPGTRNVRADTRI